MQARIAALPLTLALVACQQMGYKPRGTSGPTIVTESDAGGLRDLRQHTFVDDDSIRCFEPELSPDGMSLAFTMSKQEGREYLADIYIKPPNGRAQTQKTFHPFDDWGAAISPDGSKVAFATSRNGTSDIFVMNTAGGRAKRQITSGDQYDIAPSWSADGTRIAFSRYSFTAGEWEIWTFDLTSGALTSVVPGLFPQYSPVDNTLLFQRLDSTSGNFAIWTADDAGFNESQIAASSGDTFTQPKWSPDGKKIVFCSGGKVLAKSRTFSRSNQPVQFGSADDIWEVRGNDIWLVDADGTGLTQLTTTGQAEFSPSWGADNRIYFSLERDGAVNIWSALPETVDVTAPASGSGAQ